MKYFYYNITADLFSAGIVFILYFTIFAIFGLLIAINFRFTNNRSQSLMRRILRPFLYRIPNHVDHSYKYIDWIEYDSFKKLIKKVALYDQYYKERGLKYDYKKRGEMRGREGEEWEARGEGDRREEQGERLVENRSKLHSRSRDISSLNVNRKSHLSQPGEVYSAKYRGVDENLWRSFKKPSNDINKEMKASKRKSQGDLIGDGEDPEYGNNDLDRPSRLKKYIEMKRKKKEN